ncbi:cold shock protein [Haloferax gibbonsii ATCC 33959]|uniref:Cold shock protein n=1 Tax=Haloferax gibbonsii (strain ATCC 33959 / DSM 4427 / JCM 8863 / NBRC 102184 / NCIMB 2188 / Ma 2.38) TaxID=1227459 RepID=M0HQP1_HALGM|nr:cold shock protein [Haloferax gibbonsii ATCC 33959]
MANQLNCTGTVDFLIDTGYYGFLTTDDVREDVFFHLADVDSMSTVKEGDSIRFSYAQAEKGPRVIDMEKTITEPADQPNQETPPSSPNQLPGEITFYNETGGYGFISTDSVEDDVFFHSKDHSIGSIEEGRYVLFEYEQAEKGPRATDVRYMNSGDTANEETAIHSDNTDRKDEATKIFDPDNQ